MCPILFLVYHLQSVCHIPGLELKLDKSVYLYITYHIAIYYPGISVIIIRFYYCYLLIGFRWRSWLVSDSLFLDRLYLLNYIAHPIILKVVGYYLVALPDYLGL